MEDQENKTEIKLVLNDELLKKARLGCKESLSFLEKDLSENSDKEIWRSYCVGKAVLESIICEDYMKMIDLESLLRSKEYE